MARSTDDVLYEVRDDVGLITLNRPTVYNSLTVESLRLLREYSLAAQADAAIRAIVITGAGEDAFCTGGDLAELMPRIAGDEGLDLVVPDATKRFFSDVFKPVIAAINGLCIGGGFEIMLGTDLRVAARTASLGLGEVRWGHIPGGGLHVRLPSQVPWAIAMQLILTARPIDAARAYEVGLINEVVEPGAALAGARAPDRAQRPAGGADRQGDRGARARARAGLPARADPQRARRRQRGRPGGSPRVHREAPPPLHRTLERPGAPA